MLDEELLGVTGATGVVDLLVVGFEEDGVVLGFEGDGFEEEGVTEDDDHTPHVPDEEELLGLTEVTGVVVLLVLGFEEDGVVLVLGFEDDGVELVLGVTGATGVVELLVLDFTEDDGHTPHVPEEEELVGLGATGVVELLVLGFEDDGVVLVVSFEEDGVVLVVGFEEDGVVLVVGLTGVAEVFELADDVQRPQDEEAGVVLLDVAGADGVEDDGAEGEEEVLGGTTGVLYGVDEVLGGTTDAEGEVLEFPPQDEAGRPGGLEGQLAQLEGWTSWLSRPWTTPAKAELAKAKTMNALLTMLATWC